jgi:hypothetical protein
MPKKTKKTKKKKGSTTYEVRLGNVVERPGHRRDCAQVAAVVRMTYENEDEPNKELALQLLKDAIADEVYVTPLEGVTIEVTLNAYNVRERDLKVVS